MGYGCCNEILTDEDKRHATKEADKIAAQVAQEMTEENYKTFLTREYYDSLHWRLIEGARLDSNWMTYIAIKNGYGHDNFINSDKEEVRAAVAAQGYKSSLLINDKSALVRAGVAKSGYGLHILIHDDEAIVRCAVAQQGYKVDTLLKDKSISVRQDLAESGYALKTLMLDKNFYVSHAARETFLKNIAKSKNNEEATAALEHMQKLSPLECVIPGFKIRDMLEDIAEDIAKDIIKKGYCLSCFIKNKKARIRAYVAEQGYGLDILANDEDEDVRREVEKQVSL